jgi:hypothetical protein
MPWKAAGSCDYRLSFWVLRFEFCVSMAVCGHCLFAGLSTLPVLSELTQNSKPETQNRYLRVPHI